MQGAFVVWVCGCAGVLAAPGLLHGSLHRSSPGDHCRARLTCLATHHHHHHPLARARTRATRRAQQRAHALLYATHTPLHPLQKGAVAMGAALGALLR
jgi:hypothetical protein